MRVTDELLRRARTIHLGPARQQLRHDGTQCLTWYVSNDDGRFVRVEDLPGGDRVLVTVVDDKPVAGGGSQSEKACAVVRDDALTALRDVDYVLRCMVKDARVDASEL